MTETLSGQRVTTDPAAVFTIEADRAASPLAVGDAARYIQGAASFVELISLGQSGGRDDEPARVLLQAAALDRFTVPIKRLSYSSPLEIALFVSGGLAVANRVLAVAEHVARVRIAFAQASREGMKSRISAELSNEVVNLLRARLRLEAAELQRQVRDEDAATQAIAAAADVLIATDRVTIENP